MELVCLVSTSNDWWRKWSAGVWCPLLLQQVIWFLGAFLRSVTLVRARWELHYSKSQEDTSCGYFSYYYYLFFNFYYLTSVYDLTVKPMENFHKSHFCGLMFPKNTRSSFYSGCATFPGGPLAMYSLLGFIQLPKPNQCHFQPSTMAGWLLMVAEMKCDQDMMQTHFEIVGRIIPFSF